MVGNDEVNPQVSVHHHQPVLLSEILENIRFDGWVVDTTLGDGGHALEILRSGGRIIGIDVDPESLEIAEKRFLEAGIDQGRFNLVVGNFRELTNLLRPHIVATSWGAAEQTSPSSSGQTEKNITAVIFDLGVSSRELDDPKRGFSFLHPGPLDMRMDPTLGVTAKDLLNGLTKGELHELFNNLGEEKLARRFAEAVVRARQVERFETTDQLASVIEKAAGGRQGKIHPATRVFQALRIAINDELGAIKEALPQALEVIEAGGRILVISFHSLEDRIVKNTFRDWEEQGLGKAVTKKPIDPTAAEVDQNPRSRSAKLRIFEKNN